MQFVQICFYVLLNCSKKHILSKNLAGMDCGNSCTTHIIRCYTVFQEFFQTTSCQIPAVSNLWQQTEFVESITRVPCQTNSAMLKTDGHMGVSLWNSCGWKRIWDESRASVRLEGDTPWTLHLFYLLHPIIQQQSKHQLTISSQELFPLTVLACFFLYQLEDIFPGGVSAELKNPNVLKLSQSGSAWSGRICLNFPVWHVFHMTLQHEGKGTRKTCTADHS